MMKMWELKEIKDSTIAIFVTKVPGGWVHTTKYYGYGVSSVFVPDPNHQYEPK